MNGTLSERKQRVNESRPAEIISSRARFVAYSQREMFQNIILLRVS